MHDESKKIDEEKSKTNKGGCHISSSQEETKNEEKVIGINTITWP